MRSCNPTQTQTEIKSVENQGTLHKIKEIQVQVSYNLGKVPFLVAKRTDTARLEPALDAIQMKHVSTVPKGNAKTIVVGGRWIGLVFNRGFIEGISANSALNNIVH
jgi:hypothetical protein